MSAGKKTRNFGDVIRRKLAKDPALAARVENAAVNANIAREIYRIRTEAGMTQKTLADLAETSQSVIARIEDAEYDGHAINLLKKIASCLNKFVRVEFYDKPKYVAVEDGYIITGSGNANCEWVANSVSAEAVSTDSVWQMKLCAKVEVAEQPSAV